MLFWRPGWREALHRRRERDAERRYRFLLDSLRSLGMTIESCARPE
jgi:hypothetical protein